MVSKRIKNMEKHMRIAKALPEGYEKQQHLKKAKKLLDKYKERDATRSNTHTI
jgi:hypothetical protein